MSAHHPRVLILFMAVGWFCFSTDSHSQLPQIPTLPPITTAAPSPTPTPTPTATPKIYKAGDGSLMTEPMLTEIFAAHRLWISSNGSQGKRCDLSKADLSGLVLLILNDNSDPRRSYETEHLLRASLPKAIFQGAILKDSSLWGIDLHASDFISANLQDAFLFGVNLDNALLYKADLSRADLTIATLRGAHLLETNLTDANLTFCDLTGAVYEPKPKSLPYLPSLVVAKGLSTLRFRNIRQDNDNSGSEAGLVELRGALKDAGLRDQERQVNYSIQHERATRLWESGKKSEAWFQYVFFDLTCKYGMEPGRPLRILLGLIPIFAIPYLVAILFRKRFKRSGIWAVRIKDAVNKPERKTRAVAVEIQQWAALNWWRKVVAVFRGARVALFFSLVSAFSVGFHEINVGLWISSLQSREHAFRGTGWVRSIAGFQSLLSVYLLALWVLTYFGRPFE